MKGASFLYIAIGVVLFILSLPYIGMGIDLWLDAWHRPRPNKVLLLGLTAFGVFLYCGTEVALTDKDMLNIPPPITSIILLSAITLWLPLKITHNFCNKFFSTGKYKEDAQSIQVIPNLKEYYGL